MKKPILLCLCVLFICLNITFSQEEAKQLYEQAEAAAAEKNFSTATALYEEAYEQAKATLPRGDSLTGQITGKLAYEYYYARKRKQARTLSDEALAVKNIVYDENDLQLGLAYYEAGQIWLSDPKRSEKARDYTRKAIEIFEKQSDLHPKLVNAYMHLGVYAEEGEDLRSAIKYYNRALSHADKFPEEKKVRINLNINLGNLNLKKDDSRKALIYYENALALSLEVNGEDYFKTNDILTNIAIVKTRHGEYAEALKIFERVLQSAIRRSGKESEAAANVYENMGSTYASMGDENSALQYLEKAEKLYEKTIGREHPKMAGTQLHLGETYFDMGKFPQALSSYRKARDIGEIIFGKKHILVAAGHYYAGITLTEMGRYAEALEEFEQSKKALRYDPDDLRKMNSASKAADLYFALAETYAKQFESSGAKEDLLRSDEAAKVALQLMETARKGFSEKESGEFLMSQYREAFQAVLRNKWQLWRNTEEARYADEMFTLIDQVKSRSLKDGVLQNTAIRFGNIPEELLQKEAGLKAEISDLSNRVYRLEQQDSLQATADAKAILNEKKAAYQTLLTSLEKDFPNYYNLRHGQENFTLEKTRSELLRPQEALLNFFAETDFIFVVTAHQEGFYADSIALTEDLKNQIKSFRESLTEVGNSNNYQAQGAVLYNRLLAQTLQNLPASIQDLVIVPEGLLSSLPFENLVLSSESDAYLGDRYNISYAYSAALLAEQRKFKTDNSKVFAGFAGQYDSAVPDTLSDELLAALVRSGNFNLPGAQEEIRAIADLIGGSSYFSTAAREADFKEKAGAYRILHLSMHALLDERAPLFSRLLFSDKEGEKEDNYLYASELYNLNLNTDMVVLSACNTGTGKYKRGEGVMSLSRAFAYAGVPSCVMSLWKVPDAATSQIMLTFYENLQKGMRKDAALRAAKKTYRDNAIDPSLTHPFYWAGFVVTGDANSLDFLRPNVFSYWWLGAAAVVALLLFFLKSTLKSK